MSRAAEAEARWSHALEELEREVGAPIVPGELGSWCARVRTSLGHLRRQSEAHRDWQENTRDETIGVDLAFAARVEDLRQREAVAERQLVDLEEQLDVLPERGEAMRAGQRLRLELLAWIVGERARDREVTTWLHEAHVRDHGVVD